MSGSSQADRATVRRVRTFEKAGSTRDAVDAALESKRGVTISVCIPCRNEVATVGTVAAAVRDVLMTPDAPLVDELIVIDDGSSDGSGAVAERNGARVVPIEEVHAVHGPGRGKGNVLWASLVVSSGDLVVWCDADVVTFDARWVVDLVAPMLSHDDLMFVKGDFDRPSSFGGGGRTTELCARPLLSQFFPDLATVGQPLAGEYAARRSVLEQLSLMQGWGVEIGLLIDVAERFGSQSIAQVELGERQHTHQPLDALSVQAAEVMAALLERAGCGAPGESSAESFLYRADGERVPLNHARRPPVASLGPRQSR